MGAVAGDWRWLAQAPHPRWVCSRARRRPHGRGAASVLMRVACGQPRRRNSILDWQVAIVMEKETCGNSTQVRLTDTQAEGWRV